MFLILLGFIAIPATKQQQPPSHSAGPAPRRASGGGRGERLLRAALGRPCRHLGPRGHRRGERRGAEPAESRGAVTDGMGPEKTAENGDLNQQTW